MKKLEKSYQSALQLHYLQKLLAGKEGVINGTNQILSDQQIDFISRDIASIFFDTEKELKHRESLRAFIYFYLSEYFGEY